jgi:hypothetical protein
VPGPDTGSAIAGGSVKIVVAFFDKIPLLPLGSMRVEDCPKALFKIIKNNKEMDTFFIVIF